MKIEIDEVRSGSMDGELVWVCDFRRPDIQKKPIRHVRPTLVKVVSNDELPQGKRVYYSHSHFRPIGKRGGATKRIIPVFDNTGFRSYTGVPVNVFTDKESCEATYKLDVLSVASRLEASLQGSCNEVEKQYKETMDLIGESL